MELRKKTVVIKMKNSMDGENSRLYTSWDESSWMENLSEKSTQRCRYRMQYSDSTKEERVKRFNTCDQGSRKKKNWGNIWRTND